MHRVSPSHLDRMQKQSETQSLGRVDSWMGENVAGWSDRPPEDREAALRQTAETARRYGIANEGDLALLTLLLQTVRPSAEEFLARPGVAAQAHRKDANRGAVMRALYQEAGQDIAPAAARVASTSVTGGSPALQPAAQSSGVEPCLYNRSPSRYLPCDAERLQITVQPSKASSLQQVVSCSVPASFDGSLDDRKRRLLGHADLLIETIADYRNTGITPDYESQTKERARARILLEGETLPQCPEHLHDHLRLTDMTAPAGHEDLPLFTPNGRDWLAADYAAGQAFGDFLAGIWPFAEARSRVLHVALDSCAVRDGGRRAAGHLDARIRIFPRDMYELVWKIPPLAKGEHSRSRMRKKNGSGETEEEWTGGYQVGAGGRRDEYATSSKTTTGKDGTVTKAESTMTSRRGGNVSSVSHETGYPDYPLRRTEKHEQDNQTGTAAKGQLSKHESKTFGSSVLDAETASYWQVEPRIALRRNGEELEISKIANAILKHVLGLRNAIESFQHLVPKVGFSFEVSLSLFEGEIAGNWGYRPTRQAEHARIWRVERSYSIRIGMTLVDFKLEFFYGLKFEWGSVGGFKTVDVDMGGFAAVTAKASISVELRDFSVKERKFPTEGEVSLKGGLRGKAYVLGIGFESEVSIELPGKLEGDVILLGKRPFRIEGEFQLKAFRAVARARCSFLGSREKVYDWPESGPIVSTKLDFPGSGKPVPAGGGAGGPVGAGAT